MVASKYEVTKAKALAGMSEVQSVSLTSDMWTSMTMDAFLAVTYHFIDADFKPSTMLLGVTKFAQTHTAEHIKEAKTSWRMGPKGQSLLPHY